MKNRTQLTLLLGALTVSSALMAPRAAQAADADRPGWTLTFQDEFDGTGVDDQKWVKRLKWGQQVVNNELQAYVDDAFRLQNGFLDIVGEKRDASYGGQQLSYASGLLSSVFEQQYGYFEARLKVPAGKGLWPAFWLLGKNGSTGVNEIDIHEILGQVPNKVYMTVHWGSDYSAGHKSDGTNWTGPDFSADFHVFGLEWRPDAIIWTIDGVERKRHTGAGIPQVPMYMIINLAIGGDWPGAPSASTVFPAVYEIDYVRAYKAAGDDGGTGSPGTDAGTGGSTATGGARGSGASGGAPPSGGGCAVSGNADESLAPVFLAAAVGLIVNGTRRRRRTGLLVGSSSSR